MNHDPQPRTAPATRKRAPVDAHRAAQRAWKLLHEDPVRALELAQGALASALGTGDSLGEARARLALGFHLLYFATPAEAASELTRAEQLFAGVGDPAGRVLTATGLARAHWRAGRFAHALSCVLPLRDEGVQVLSGSQRGVLLNTIAGCYSSLEQSDQAFAYMYQALRDARPKRAHGYDAFLHCNLAHELLQLGDFHEALRHVDQGLERSERLKNPRLLGVLLVNRIICLTELGRAREALHDIQRVCELPTGPRGRGTLTTHFETMAIAAFQSDEHALGCELTDRAMHALHAPIADEHVELAIANAMRAEYRGDGPESLRLLDQARAWFSDDTAAHGGGSGASLRARCLFWHTRCGMLERMGRTQEALDSLHHWQHAYIERADLASRARYQAAALQTELLTLQCRLEEHDARRRATERARAELEQAHHALSSKMQEVQALQAALREQAVRDDLTGLFNRRQLNEALPQMLSLAQRDGTPVAMVMIDLDHFKAVNDRYGHEAGDRVLAAFGLLLARSCRKSDVACRWGGEEFCLLMAQTSATVAQRKAQTLLRRWRDTRLHIGGVVIGELSFSAGVIDSSTAGHHATALLAVADAELLLAKSAGRNRVRVRAAAAPAASAALAPGE